MLYTITNMKARGKSRHNPLQHFFSTQILPQAGEQYRDTQSSSFKTAVSILGTFIKTLGIGSTKEFNTKYKMVLHSLKSSKRSKETKRKIAYFMALAYQTLNNITAQKEFLKLYNKYKYEIQRGREKNAPINTKEQRCLQHVSLKKLRSKPIDFGALTPDDLLFNLLVRMDETPRNDYRLLVYTNEEPKQVQGNNYLVCLSNGSCKILLGKYKTYSTYGVWKMNISEKYPELARYIEQFIAHWELPNNTVLFLNKVKKPYPSNKFSEHIQTLFENKTGFRISMNCFRKIKANALFHQNPRILNMPLEEQKKWIEEHFRHGLATSNLYYKRVDKDDPVSVVTWNESVQSSAKALSVSNRVPSYSASTVSTKKSKKRKYSKSNKSRLWAFRDALKSVMKEYNVNDNEVTKLLSGQLLI